MEINLNCSNFVVLFFLLSIILYKVPKAAKEGVGAELAEHT